MQAHSKVLSFSAKSQSDFLYADLRKDGFDIGATAEAGACVQGRG
jgi:hypothetical protein